MTWQHVSNVRIIDPSACDGSDPPSAYDQTHGLQGERWIVEGRFAPDGVRPSSHAQVTRIDGHGRVMVPQMIDLRAQWDSDAARGCHVGGVGHVMTPGAQTDCFFYRGASVPTESGVVVRPLLGVDRDLAGNPITQDDVFARAAYEGRSVWTHLSHPAWYASTATRGVMAEGAYALRLGLAAQAARHQAQVITRIAKAASTHGTMVHISGLATAQGVMALRAAKSSGLPLTADVSIHHLLLADVDVGYFDTRHKFDPPLGTVADRQALSAAVLDATIDAVVSDHTTVTPEAKADFFSRAGAGAPAMGLVLPLMLAWAQRANASLAHALRPLTTGPARVLARDGAVVPAGLDAGYPADFCLLDPDLFWRVEERLSQHTAALSPFGETFLTGAVVQTYSRGHLVVRESA